MKPPKTSYPSDVSGAEWDFLVPYLTLMREDAPQREYSSRKLFTGLRYVLKTARHWRSMPKDLPPWTAVYQQDRRWLAAGVFEEIGNDVRVIVRLFEERNPQPSATILDSRTLQATPKSGGRADFDGAKKKKGSKVHIAVETLGNLLALKVTAANEQDRAQAADLSAKVQEVTGGTVEIGFVDQGDTGESPEAASGKQWNQTGRSETLRAQKRFRFTSPLLGGRTDLWLARKISTFGKGLRTINRSVFGLALGRLCYPLQEFHKPFWSNQAKRLS